MVNGSTAEKLNNLTNPNDLAGKVRPDLDPYLDRVTSNGGVAKKENDSEVLISDESLGKIFAKEWHAGLCMHSADKFTGAESGKNYYRFLHCRQWFCPTCGTRKGVIVKRRVSRVREKMGKALDQGIMRQVVFTVPQAHEMDFMSKDGLNSLLRMSEKVIRDRFPGLFSVAAIHLFGDKGDFRFRPHVQILMLDKPGCMRQLSKDDIAGMREKWRYALSKKLSRVIKVVDIHVSYAVGIKKKMHILRYALRPCPGPEEYKKMQPFPHLLEFCMNTLEGFMYVRKFNGCRMKGISDPTAVEMARESQGAAGERLIFEPYGQITRTEFNMRYHPKDYDELSPGFYRIRDP